MWTEMGGGADDATDALRHLAATKARTSLARAGLRLRRTQAAELAGIGVERLRSRSGGGAA